MNYNEKRRIYIYSLECFENNGFSRIKIGETKKDLLDEEGVLERIQEQKGTGVPHKIKLLDWWYSNYIEDTDLHRELELVYDAQKIDRFNEWFTLSVNEVKIVYDKLKSRIDLYEQIAKLKIEKSQLEKELISKETSFKSELEKKDAIITDLMGKLTKYINLYEGEILKNKSSSECICVKKKMI